MTLLNIGTPSPFCTNMFSSRTFICNEDPSCVDLYCDIYFASLKSSLVDLYRHFWFCSWCLFTFLLLACFFPLPLHEKWLHVCSLRKQFHFWCSMLLCCLLVFGILCVHTSISYLFIWDNPQTIFSWKLGFSWWFLQLVETLP